MTKPYEQDVVLDVAGKPIYDAMTAVQRQIDTMARTLQQMGKDTYKDAQAYRSVLEANIKSLKQARSDLKALQDDKTVRGKGYAAAEKAARDLAKAEVSADKQATKQKLIEAQNFYGEKKRLARDTARQEREDEKTGERITAAARATELAGDKAKIASAKELAAARREAAQAGMSARVKGLTGIDDARAAKAASDARLANLRREATSFNDAQVARSLAARIQMEKALGRELDATIRKLNTQAESARRAFSTIGTKDLRLLAPSDVAARAGALGSAGAAKNFYLAEQAAARETLRATMRSTTATAEQRVQAQRTLEIANRRVTAAQRLVSEEEKQLRLQARQAAAAERAAAAEAKRAGARSPIQNILSPGYAATAFARTAVYGGAAGLAYGAFNALQGGVSQVVEMEDELMKLQAIANATDPQLQRIKTSIFQIGSNSRFAVTDLAKISQTLAQAGITSGDMGKVLQSVTTLATASGSTPDEAVNLVTSALGSFQLQASEAGRVADLMTAALNRTKLTVQQTGQAIQYVGATAFEQNISLEQMLATIGGIAQAGVRSGSTIGTGFRQFLVDLQTPSEKLTKQLTSLGITSADVNVTVRGLPAVLDTLREKGFGAAQAYSGLETRAAAFYLVAKNNTDIMDQLQISFAQQGASALANERAMNSVTAQWQRFKNVISEGFGESMEVPLALLKDVLRRISDSIEESKIAAQQLEERRANGTATIPERVNPAAMKFLQGTQRIILNGANFRGDGSGLGDQWESYVRGLNAAAVGTQQLATRASDASEEVDKQAGKIGELDNEISRLITQQSSLQGNSLRTGAETVTLTARFEGLAKYLTNAKDRYGDLMQAMSRYRSESLKTQQSFLNAQISAGGLQFNEARARATNEAAAVQGQVASGALNLTARERAALAAPRIGGNTAVLRDAGERLNNDSLRRLVVALGDMSAATSMQSLATDQLNNVVTENTKAGQNLTQRLVTSEAKVGELAGLNRDARNVRAGDVKKIAQTVIAEVDARLANPRTAKEALPTLRSMRSRAEAVVAGADASLAESKAEAKARKANERSEKSAAREAQRGEPITQSDIDGLTTAITKLRLGSGPRTAAEQDGLFRAGKTKATSATSGHVGRLARDFRTGDVTDAEGERLAAAARAYYAERGIPVRVQYENGRGSRNGTGKHVHVQVLNGARKNNRQDNPEAAAFDRQIELDNGQTEVDQRAYNDALKDVKVAAGTEVFDAAVGSAQLAMTRLNADLFRDAENELAKNGITEGDPRYAARMAQIAATAQQNLETFNDAVAEGFIKSIQLQAKAAQTAFDAAIAPALARQAIAEAQLSGLDSYSNRNNVPDYVKQLAQDRSAQASERVDQARLAAMPDVIRAAESRAAQLREQIGKGGDAASIDKLKGELASLNVELVTLTANRDALEAKLGSGGLVPTTMSAGLEQAIQAYRQANGMGRTFQQDVIMNFGGAIETVNTGLTDMFGSIITGSQSALGAFATFAAGIGRYIQQMVAKIIATKVLSLLFNIVGGAIGGSVDGAAVDAAASSATDTFIKNMPGPILTGSYTGGPAMGGGEVMNGSVAKDSVTKKLARGEWVVQKNAVDSVGNEFMAQLNTHGAKALDTLSSVPQIDMKTRNETNVYVVPPDQKPSLSKNDVLVILGDDLLNGQSRRLVQHVVREG